MGTQRAAEQRASQFRGSPCTQLGWRRGRSQAGELQDQSPPCHASIHYTLQLERLVMSHSQISEAVACESQFRKPWAEREKTACRHAALGCDLKSCREIWAQTLWGNDTLWWLWEENKAQLDCKGWMKLDLVLLLRFYPPFSLPCSFLQLPPKSFTN